MGAHHDHLPAHHHHGHGQPPDSLNTAFIVGIVLNLLFVVVEFLAGYYNHSMALISDAGHNLVDVFSLVLALVAFRMARIKSTSQMTYGYSKTTILASLINAVFLFFAIGGIAWESYHRLLEPQIIQGSVTIVVAAIGIGINALTAFLFFRRKDKDLNIKGAYLHMMADALVSLGVVLAGIIIVFTGWYIVDTIMSFIIILVIFFSTWRLFRDSLRLTMDGVPRDLDMEQIIEKVKNLTGVVDLHHVHIWAISTTTNAFTGHVVVGDDMEIDSISSLKHEIRHIISDSGVHHITLEVEKEMEQCQQPDC